MRGGNVRGGAFARWVWGGCCWGGGEWGRRTEEGGLILIWGGDALQQYPQPIPQRQHDAIQQHFILLPAANNIEHHIALHLKDYDLPIVEDHITCRLVRLLEQALLECFLGFHSWVRVCARGIGGEGRVLVRG